MSVSTSPSLPDTSVVAAAERETRAALRADQATSQYAEAVFERIPFGLSNIAWRATPDADESVFVRLAMAGTERLGADHRNECRVLALAADAGIAPRVVRCDPQARLLVTRWIETATAPPEAEQLRVVGALLARLHASEVPADIRDVDFERQSRLLEQSLPAACRELRSAAALNCCSAARTLFFAATNRAFAASCS